MRRNAALLSAAIVLGTCVRYCWLTWHGDIHPVLTTWILFWVAVLLSFSTYWSSEKHSIIGNIGNAVDVVAVTTNLSCIVLLGRQTRFRFTPTEIACLAACGIILVVWRLSRQHVVSNLALQVVMTVAYIPTIVQLWGASTNSESIVTWSLIWLAGVLSFIPAIIDRDRLAIAYATRATIMVTVLIGLMVRIALRT